MKFADLDDLTRRAEAGEDIRITIPDMPKDALYRRLYSGDTHVAELDECPACEAGHEPTSPTGRLRREVEFTSPEMQQFKKALDKYHEADEEIVRAMREYLMEKQREKYATLFDAMPQSTLVALSLAGIESRILHQEIIRHHAMDVPMVVYIGDTGSARRSLLADRPAMGKSLHDLSFDDALLDEAHFFPKMLPIEPKEEGGKPRDAKRDGGFVGRFGTMPVPPLRNRKFKKRLHSHKGRKR